MTDLIDRQAALDAFYHIRCNLQMMDDTQTADKIMHGLWLAENAIKLVTSVPIVRCKDCKQYQEWVDGNVCLLRVTSSYRDPSPNGYCSYAERRTDE